MKLSRNFVVFIAGCLILWMGLFLGNFLFLEVQDIMIRAVAKLVYLPHFFILLTAFKIYQNASQNNRKMLFWLVITNVGLLLNDISWYFVTYFHFNITHISPTAFLLNLIPFFIWVAALIVFSAKILNRHILQVNLRIKTFCVLFLINCVIILLFLSAIHYAAEVFSLSTVAQISTFIAQVIVFDFVILCLIYTESRGLSTFLAGIIVLIAGDFFIIYSTITETRVLYYYGELLWLLGLLFNLFGVLMIQYEGDYEIKSWVRKDNTIKSKLIFWCFSAAILSFLSFFVIAYSFSIISRTVFLGLPLFIMVYSVIVIVLFSYVGKYFEVPFKQITGNIKTLMLEDKRSKMYTDFSIEEFVFLQGFITDTFLYRIEREQERLKLEREHIQSEMERAKTAAELKEEQLKNEAFQAAAKEQEKFRKIVDQAVHDVGSPLATARMILLQCDMLPEHQRNSLSTAMTRIQDITRNLLNQFKPKHEETTNDDQLKCSATLISSDILEIIGEKRYEYTQLSIEFITFITQAGYFAFVSTNNIGFKRMLSNLINNAVDALEGKLGLITVHVDVTEDKQVQVIVEDNGKGMPEAVKDKILNNIAVTSGKADGHGIGFGQIRDTLASSDGELAIEPEPGKGTKIILTFPQVAVPDWICSQIELNPENIVVILDDEPSIHIAWEARFTKAAPNMQRQHFEQGVEAIKFINSQSDEDKAKIFLLTDYELLK